MSKYLKNFISKSRDGDGPTDIICIQKKDIVMSASSIGTSENDFLLNGFDVSIPYVEAMPGKIYRIIIIEDK